MGLVLYLRELKTQLSWEIEYVTDWDGHVQLGNLKAHSYSAPRRVLARALAVLVDHV